MEKHQIRTFEDRFLENKLQYDRKNRLIIRNDFIKGVTGFLVLGASVLILNYCGAKNNNSTIPTRVKSELDRSYFINSQTDLGMLILEEKSINHDKYPDAIATDLDKFYVLLGMPDGGYQVCNSSHIDGGLWFRYLHKDGHDYESFTSVSGIKK